MNSQLRKPPKPISQQPGAGIPMPQQLYLRYYMGPFLAARSDWDQNWRNFDTLNEKIFRRVEHIPPAKMLQPVLIHPVPGLEDSSRNWSIAMTFEHLMLVGQAQVMIIRTLCDGTVPQGEARTADVKPKGGTDALEQIQNYKDFLVNLRTEIGPLKEAALRSTIKFAHPWFGPFTAKQWQWLFTAHTAIHYRQIKDIVKGLRE